MIEFRSQLRTLLTVIITFFLTRACASTNSPAPTDKVILTTTNTPQLAEPLAPHVIEPLVTAPILRFDSWSRDSQWIASWIASVEDQPAHLAFINVQSGKVCQQNDVVADKVESGHVTWAENDSVIVVQNLERNALKGMPCGEFSPTEPVEISNIESSISPDGRYRADTIIGGWEGELIHNVTTITEVSTKKIAATIKWDGSPHAWAEIGWLNNQLYLVGLDVNRGPLYTSMREGKVGNVVSDLLGLNVQNVGYISRVGRYTDSTKVEYHLLLVRSVDLPLLLYHSELNKVEELSFHESFLIGGFTFSPDGKWLFFSRPSTKQNSDVEDFWIRSVDPPESSAVKLAEGMNFAGFSDEAHKMIFIDKNYVLYALDFPNGGTIGSWYSSDYYIDRIWWSPDGKRVAMQGFPVKSQTQAIFIIEP